jgi:hypothetical protein
VTFTAARRRTRKVRHAARSAFVLQLDPGTKARMDLS